MEHHVWLGRPFSLTPHLLPHHRCLAVRRLHIAEDLIKEVTPISTLSLSLSVTPVTPVYRRSGQTSSHYRRRGRVTLEDSWTWIRQVLAVNTISFICRPTGARASRSASRIQMASLPASVGGEICSCLLGSTHYCHTVSESVLEGTCRAG